MRRGLVVGPAVGLIGHGLVRWAGTYQLGIVAAVLPFVLACWFGALRSLSRWAPA